MMYPALRVLLQDELDERWREGIKAGLIKGEKAGLIKGEKVGLAKGEKVGLMKGISGAVGIYRDELGLDDAAITERIAKRYNLTKEQAARYVTTQGA